MQQHEEILPGIVNSVFFVITVRSGEIFFCQDCLFELTLR